MSFYEVWVRSNHYHGTAGLTYSSPQPLNPGQIVTVPLKNELVTGVITTVVNQPSFKVKEVANILDLPPLPKAQLSLIRWLSEYYPSPIGILTQQFIPPAINLKTVDTKRSHTATIHRSSLPKLTPEQSRAYKSMADNDSYLLHGRTGSGKTRLYIELAISAVEQGHSAVILTPEISLTTQLSEQFINVFGDRATVIHSGLTPKQRRERWLKLLTSDQPQIVIGARSAIFSPLRSVGLIVIDECHEPAYKQEHAPYYLTTRVAAQLRTIHNAKLVLGSATPSISDYYLAEQRRKPIIQLKTLARKDSMHHLKTTLINSKDRTQFNTSTYLSDILIQAMEQALSKHQQVLLYLNRRGTARVILCEQCDWQAHCPHCNTPLTYHGDTHNLRCHVCGYTQTSPTTCPECHNPSIKYLSIGTKALEEEVKKIFRDAIVKRYDTDNRKSERLEQHYHELYQGKVDIIIGTQLLAKGLDLPNLSVVGVILADVSLQLPDFSVNERTYQLLSQVKGRIGRGHIEGQAIIQTYQPNNAIITAALSDNWSQYYTQELEERKQYLFPPFCHLLKVTVQRASPESANTALLRFIQLLPKGVTVEGPAPAFHERHNNLYRWQLVIKSAQRSQLVAIVRKLPGNGWSYDIDPINLI